MKLERPRGPIPEPTLRRLPSYLRLAQRLREQGTVNVSSSAIAAALQLDPTQVRKDLQAAGVVGRPRVGFALTPLIERIETTLGWRDAVEAYLVGAGHLGLALLGYERFEERGLRIVAGFDVDPHKIGTFAHGRPILSIARLTDMIRRNGIGVVVLAVPPRAAQSLADDVVQAGVVGIWNFAPIRLSVPPHVAVEHVDLVASLAVLTRKLEKRAAAETGAA